MDLKTIKAMAQVVGYLEHDEAQSYNEMVDGEDKGAAEYHASHIYNDVQVLRAAVVDWCDMIEGKGVYKAKGHNPAIAQHEVDALREQVALNE